MKPPRSAPPRSNLLLVAVMVASIALLAACGGGDDEGGGGEVQNSAGPEEEALVDNATFLAEGFLDGNADQVYEMSSARCQETQTIEQVEAFVAGGEAADTSVDEVEVTSFDGDTASVSITFAAPALNLTDTPWVLEDDGWRVDLC